MRLAGAGETENLILMTGNAAFGGTGARRVVRGGQPLVALVAEPAAVTRGGVDAAYMRADCN